MPSHVSDIGNDTESDDIDQMIDAAHGAGFDVICAAVIFTGSDEEDRTQFADIWRKAWEERWTIPNPHNDAPEGPLDALGRDLWTWICRVIAS